MGATLTQNLQETKLVVKLAELEKAINDIRANQAQKLVFVDVILDGTGTHGTLTFGSGNTSVFLKPRTGGGVDFFNGANTKIASLDSNGNLKCLGTITPSTTP